ncbi:MAG TPA: hypothetical protein VHY19_08675 [Steroidobacteraceae bacterium]|jgi:hypothetical protein|nr:hypothetical protein [Steroidobacteraceae bacterium]
MSGKASVKPTADVIRSVTAAAAAVLLLSLLALPVSARADCTTPEAAVQIPNGTTATRDQMVAAQRAVKAYDTAVKTYGDCLQHELDAKLASGGDKALLEAQYDLRNRAEVDKLQKLASKFNDELRAFKAKNSG